MKTSEKLLGRVLCLSLVMLLTSCRQSDPETARRTAIKVTLDRLSQCAPKTSDNAKLKLAIAEITSEPLETNVHLVAYATSEPVEFYLPIYLMSRGRWTINETERVYLLDESCREYKLKERKLTNTKAPPPAGRLNLKPGEAFEFKLGFPRLPDETRLGALVYGSTVIPFSLLPAVR
jgi:hypothetical protein